MPKAVHDIGEISRVLERERVTHPTVDRSTWALSGPACGFPSVQAALIYTIKTFAPERSSTEQSKELA